MNAPFLTLLALVSGRRINLHGGKPGRDAGYELSLTDFESFDGATGSVLAESLRVPAGQTLVLDLQERRKVGRPHWYDVFVTGKNGQQTSPVQIGTVTSLVNPSPARSRQDFKDTSGKPITRMHWSHRPSISTKARAYIVQPGSRRKATYYTFEKLSPYGMYNQYHNLGYSSRREESFSVYYGKCPKKSSPSCGGLALLAKGHFKGFNFNFFKPGSSEPVAYMSMVERYWGLGGKKERFRMTVLPGADVLMLAQLVSFIALCNNDEEAQ